MATTKKAEPKKEKTTEEEVKSLRSELDAITFKNKQAKDIAAMNAGKEKLKDKLSSNRQRRVGGSSRISGLGKLGGLASFKQKYKDY
jgi:uncharacterized coiled-coil DUF342 family protein